MLTTPLSTGWTLTLLQAGPGTPEGLHGLRMPARVPGCVHTDLMDAGLLDDPYIGLNEQAQHWVGRSTWQYTTTFEAPDAPSGARHELRFAGLDTIADVSLNGRLVGHGANMHRTYVFDVTDVLRRGQNTLSVVLSNVYAYTDAMREKVGEMPATYDEPFQYVRKMASNFGWDWGPTVVTAGIWKDVDLLTWDHARIEAVRPLVTVEHDRAPHRGHLAVHADIRWNETAAASPLRIEARIAGHAAACELSPGTTTCSLAIDVDDVSLWWPIGEGEQPLYDLRLQVHHAVSGEVLDTWAGKVGFRTVELNTEPDAGGTPFELVVNGRLLNVRGANWIPEDCFVARLGPDDYEAAIANAVDTHTNLLRVWGGGIYEQDAFYDICDRLGLLVWQDFLFACAAYTEEEPLRSEIAAEARDNVTRLSPHPSLVLWNGCNENIWGYEEWGWKDALGEAAWGLGYYLDLLPSIVAGLDPTRPYWPGSPYSGSLDLHPNDQRHGPMHIWDVWNQRDYTAYAEYEPRFVAEFGFQGPACLPTIERAVNDEPAVPDGPVALAHQKAERGHEKLLAGLRVHLPLVPRADANRAMADWIYLAQLNQARAIEFGIDHFRSRWPECTGTIVWQLNDCWPVTSWSAVDGDGRRKLLWYALRRAHRPRQISLTGLPGGRPAAHAINNSGETWSGRLTVELHGLGGERIAASERPFVLEPGQRFSSPIDTGAHGTVPLVVTAHADGVRARRLSAEDIDAALPAPRFKLETAEHGPDHVAVTVIARSLLRDLVLAADRLDPDARVDEQMITLLPGEQHSFVVRTSVSARDSRWHDPLVLRCVNDLTIADAEEVE